MSWKYTNSLVNATFGFGEIRVSGGISVWYYVCYVRNGIFLEMRDSEIHSCKWIQVNRGVGVVQNVGSPKGYVH